MLISGAAIASAALLDQGMLRVGKISAYTFFIISPHFWTNLQILSIRPQRSPPRSPISTRPPSPLSTIPTPPPPLIRTLPTPIQNPIQNPPNSHPPIPIPIPISFLIPTPPILPHNPILLQQPRKTRQSPILPFPPFMFPELFQTATACERCDGRCGDVGAVRAC